MPNCPNEYCAERFHRLEGRVDQKSRELDRHAVQLAHLEEKFDSLTHSLQGLTKALWGVSGAIVSMLLGFFIWYVQGL